MGLYEAQLSFTSPHASRRFRQHVVYDLDAEVEQVLAGAIQRGWLVAVSPAEYEGFRLLGGTEESPAQDPGDQGDGHDDGTSPTTPPGSSGPSPDLDSVSPGGIIIDDPYRAHSESS